MAGATATGGAPPLACGVSRARRLLFWCATVVLAAAPIAGAQTLPDATLPVLRPAFDTHECAARPSQEPADDAERARFEMRARYRTVLPAFLARVPDAPVARLAMPVDGVRVAQVADTWGAARGEGRRHEGQDLFAPRGTPVRAAAPGLVYRIDDLSRGGLSVTVVGGAGWRFFYTHLDGVAADLREGQWVDVGTLLGFVGNSGNAAGTPPHLHLGVYAGTPDDPCAWAAFDPLPLLVDRD